MEVDSASDGIQSPSLPATDRHPARDQLPRCLRAIPVPGCVEDNRVCSWPLYLALYISVYTVSCAPCLPLPTATTTLMLLRLLESGAASL